MGRRRWSATRMPTGAWTFAERSWPELSGPRQEEWFDRLEAEHPNLRAALGWLRERGDGERGLLLASRLSWFWSSRGYLREAREWIEGFLGMPTSALTRGDGLQQAGTILQWQGDDERAQAYNEEALTDLPRARRPAQHRLCPASGGEHRDRSRGSRAGGGAPRREQRVLLDVRNRLG